jgi:hypothetical protein
MTRIDRNSPCLKQPFGDIAAIPVVLAPGSQAIRGGVGLWSESQLPGLLVCDSIDCWTSSKVLEGRLAIPNLPR